MFQVSSLAPLAFSLPDLSLSTYQMLGPQLTPTLCISRSLPSRGAGFRIWATLTDPLLLSAHWGSGHPFQSLALLKVCSYPHLVALITVNAEACGVAAFLASAAWNSLLFLSLHFCDSHFFLFHGRLSKSSSLGGSRERQRWRSRTTLDRVLSDLPTSGRGQSPEE